MSEQLAIPSKKGEVSEEEWQLRIDLAAAYRLIEIGRASCRERVWLKV
jgi:hypothetical protein